jgi:hypothetical protein
MSDLLKPLWDVWWLRGVVAAIGILHFAHVFLGYSVFEASAAILAVLALWQEFMGWLGNLIGRFPFFPPLSSNQVLYLSLLASFSLPVAIHAARDLRLLRHESQLAAEQSRVKSQREKLRGRRLAWLQAKRLDWRLKRLSSLNQPGAFAFALSLFLAALTSTGLLVALVFLPQLPFGSGAVWVTMAAVGVGFALACRQRIYRVGVVILAGFVLALQLAYWADAPGTRDFVQRQAAIASHSP